MNIPNYFTFHDKYMNTNINYQKYIWVYYVVTIYFGLLYLYLFYSLYISKITSNLKKYKKFSYIFGSISILISTFIAVMLRKYNVCDIPDELVTITCEYGYIFYLYTINIFINAIYLLFLRFYKYEEPIENENFGFGFDRLLIN